MTDTQEAVEQEAIPVEAQEVIPEPKETERTFKQSELDNIVKTRMEHARQQAYEQARREMQAQQSGQQNQGSPEDEKIRQMILSEANRLSQEQMAGKIVNEFINKVETGKQKYPDIESAIQRLDLAGNNSDIIPWLNGLDNAVDVISAMDKDPAKYANVLMLAARSPHLVPQALHQLSTSIKQNQQAQDTKMPNEPLDQIRPSTTSSDSGTNTVSDWRKKPWLKG